jgi:hypothetical protein
VGGGAGMSVLVESECEWVRLGVRAGDMFHPIYEGRLEAVIG